MLCYLYTLKCTFKSSRITSRIIVLVNKLVSIKLLLCITEKFSRCTLHYITHLCRFQVTTINCLLCDCKKCVHFFQLLGIDLANLFWTLQDHYDFGMRAVKSVISAAGNLKRQYPDMNEVIGFHQNFSIVPKVLNSNSSHLETCTFMVLFCWVWHILDI